MADKAKKSWEKAIKKFDLFFNTGKHDVCRGHFTYAVAIIAQQLPSHIPALSAATSFSRDAISNSVNGKKVGGTDRQRQAAAKYACTEAHKAGATIPASLAAKVNWKAPEAAAA